MSSMQLRQLLIERQWLQLGDEPQSQTPWYISILLGVCGWLAALFFMLFIGLGLWDSADNASVLMVVALFLLGLAVALLRLSQHLLLEHMGIVFSLSGQLLLLLALLAMEVFEFEQPQLWLLVLALQLLLIILGRSYLHRLLTCFFAANALAITLALSWMLALYAPLIVALLLVATTLEFRRPAWAQLMAPCIIGLALALVPYLFGSDNWFGENWYMDWLLTRDQRAPVFSPLVVAWLGFALSGLLLLWLVWSQARAQGCTLHSRGMQAALFAVVMMAAIAYHLPHWLTLCTLWVLAWSRRDYWMLGLSLLLMVFALGAYYYNLQQTLLVKSAYLLLTALVTGLAAFALKRTLAAGENDAAL